MVKSWQDSLAGKFFPKTTARPRALAARLCVEQLEIRLVLAGTWTPFTDPGPTGGLGTMMLLSDGRILAPGAGASNDWFQLTPGASGNYATSGSWSFLTSFGTPREFYASNVLPDGRALVLGGEYSGSPAQANDTNTGQIFAQNQWSSIPNFPQAKFGDDPTMVLDDGTVLCGYILGPQTYLFNPNSTTTPWIQVSPRIHADERGDEETWLKLPDGSVLSYDLWNDVSAHASTAERYIPAIGAWIDAGTVPVDLSDANEEMGGATLLPDGRAWFVGDNGHTAFYTPPSTLFGTGSWTAGPNLPNGQVADDAPLCELTNGHVLLALDGPGAAYSPPTHIYDFNPFVDFTHTNPFTQVDPPGVDLSHVQANKCRMLALPDGTACVEVNGSGQLFEYKPDSGPNAAWAPSINAITASGGTFTLSGTQLNGISAGASYGDDAEMDSNYPIVEFIDHSLNYHYAQTFNWTSTDVQTGSTLESTNYTLPAGLTDGAFWVQVVASGIASARVLDVVMDSSLNNITLTLDPNPFLHNNFIDLYSGGNLLSRWGVTSFSAVDVTMNGTGGTVNIRSTPAGIPVNVYGVGQSTINIGSNIGVQNILGPINLENPPNFNTIIIDDSGDSAARTATLSTVTVLPVGRGTGGLSDQLSGLAPATISWNYADTSQVTIRGGSGSNTWNVQGTGVPTTLDTGAGANTVNIGTGDLDNLEGPVTVVGNGGTDAVIVNDQDSTSSHAYAVTGTSQTGTIFNRDGFAGLITDNVASLTVNGASSTGTIQYDVESSVPGTPITINGDAAQNNFVISPTAKDLGNVAAPVTLNGCSGNNFLTFDDQAAPAGESFTVTSSSLSRSGSATVSYSGMNNVTVNGGSHQNTFSVPSLANGNVPLFTLFIYCGAGGDTLTAGNATNGMDVIQASLAVVDNFGQSTLILNDQASSVSAMSYTIFEDEVLRGSTQVDYANLKSLVLDVGRGRNDQVQVVNTLAPTAVTINAGAGSDTFTVGQDANGLGGIDPNSLVSVAGSAGGTTLVLDDRGNTQIGAGLTVFDGQVFQGSRQIDYSGLKDLVLDTGTGIGNEVDVLGTPAALALTINPGGNTQVVHAGSAVSGQLGLLQGPLTVTGFDVHLFVFDQGTEVGETYTLTATTIKRTGGFSLTYSNLEFLTIDGSSGTDTWLISSTPNAGLATLNGGGGNNTFRFTGSASLTGTINGGSGVSNKLDFSALAGPVSVDLQTGAASPILGGNAGGFSNLNSFLGSTSAGDTLTGPDANTNWTISSANGGSGSGSGFRFTFARFENLVGGAGVDVFKFTAAGSLAGSLDGGGAPANAGNWLDYSGLTTPVTVNLQAGSASGVGVTVSNIQDVHGGNGGNTLVGDSQGNILIGGTGNDTITGGSGASLLIGDKGADTIQGGSGGDLLIGDATTFDTMTAGNEAALMSILAEWQSSDSYATRFHDINTGTGGGLNGTARLRFGTTVKDDSASDTVTAAASSQALDWFFQGIGDTLHNVEAGEHINNT
jgi:hypothetical protein